jgi:predicted nucleic acid-binding protein
VRALVRSRPRNCESRRGEPRGARAVDLIIAATALAHDIPLYTRNAKDLRGLEKLIAIVDVTG